METFLFWLKECSYDQLTLSYTLKSDRNYSIMSQYGHFVVYGCKLKQKLVPEKLTKDNIQEHFEIKMIVYASTGYDRGRRILLLESEMKKGLYSKMIGNEIETQELKFPCTVFLPMDCTIQSFENYDGYLVDVGLDLDIENVNLVTQPTKI